jgi:N-acetylglucosamine-6-phosphate deacetylase
MTGLVSYVGARVFDGTAFAEGALVVDAGSIVGIGAPQGRVVELPGGIVAPGFLDLQVNGAGGVAVDGALTLDGIRHICATQARLGATGCLPTLITDTPDATRAVIAAGVEATRARVPGFLGLHLEGPHLDPRRKGAHDPGLIRAMRAGDLDMILAAAGALPALMVTVAPEAVTDAQIAEMAAAGVVVSLGHSDCTAARAARAMAAGARCATHLFNAMSQFGNREPGLVGAVLGSGVACGLIADGIHVAPLALRVALAAKRSGVFLVSDCMAPAGTDADSFMLNGRRVLRSAGRLTLEDGTLAGADVTLPQSVDVLVRQVGLAPERALTMATSVPAEVLRSGDRLGHLLPGRAADFVHLSHDGRLAGAWRAGVPVT